VAGENFEEFMPAPSGGGGGLSRCKARYLYLSSGASGRFDSHMRSGWRHPDLQAEAGRAYGHHWQAPRTRQNGLMGGAGPPERRLGGGHSWTLRKAR